MKKRVPLLVLTIAMLIMSIVGSASASSLSVDMEQLTTDIAGYVSAWVVDNYSEHYSLSHYSGEVAECEVKGSQFRAAVPVVVYTTLKYSSAESLPYMEGMKDALNIASFGDIASVASADRSGEFSRILSEANPHLDTEIVDDLAATLSSRYSDVEECIGTPTELFVDFVVTGHIVKGKMDKISLYVDETGALIDASLYAPKSAEALADEGRSDTLNMLQEGVRTFSWTFHA